MKHSILTFILSLFLGTTLAHGAVITVGPGESIQSVIDSASSGDVLNLSAPIAYNGDLNITKPLRIVGVRSINQNLFGDINIEGIPAGQSVTLKNLSINGVVEIRNSSVNLLRCDLASSLSANNPGGGNTLLTFVQSSIIGKLTSKMSRSWIGYSNLRQSSFEGIVEIVGNDFNGNALGGIGIDLNGTQTMANIHNNLIHDYKKNTWEDVTNSCIGIRVKGNAKTEIRNNSIINNYDQNHDGTETFVGMGIYVESTANTTIIANLLKDNHVARGDQTGGNFVEIGNTQVYAPKSNVTMRNNALGGHGEKVKGGVVHWETVSDTSEGTEFLTHPLARMAGKGGQDTGSQEDYHKDHDGSRNDIGANGGRNYIPDGRTTNKPIPIFFSLAPQAVPVGGTVTIESTGATVK